MGVLTIPNRPARAGSMATMQRTCPNYATIQAWAGPSANLDCTRRRERWVDATRVVPCQSWRGLPTGLDEPREAIVVLGQGGATEVGTEGASS